MTNNGCCRRIALHTRYGYKADRTAKLVDLANVTIDWQTSNMMFDIPTHEASQVSEAKETVCPAYPHMIGDLETMEQCVPVWSAVLYLGSNRQRSRTERGLCDETEESTASGQK